MVNYKCISKNIKSIKCLRLRKLGARMNKRILAGLHDSELIKDCNNISKTNGYSVDFVNGDEDMLRKAKETEYGGYLMEVVSEDVTPVIRVYNLVRLRTIKGLAKFVLIGDEKAVEKAKKMGIPSQKREDFSLASFLS